MQNGKRGRNKSKAFERMTIFPIEPKTAAMPLPKIVIPLRVMMDMFRYATAAKNEVGGVGYIEENDGELYVSDIFLLKQKASAADMTLDPMALNEFVAECESPELIKLQWHSHGYGSVFFSSQDVETISGYDMPYAVSIVVNKNFDIRCRIDIFNPIYVCFEAAVFLEIKDADSMQASIKVEALVEEGNKKATVETKERLLIPIGEAYGIAKMMEGGVW